MKFQKLFLLLLVGMLTLSACQFGAAPQKTEAPAATQETQPGAAPQTGGENPYPIPQMGGAYPYPAPPEGGPYPYPGVYQDMPTPTVGGVLYPDLQDGQEIYLSQAAGLIRNGEVQKVVIGADLKVFMTLKDGRVFTFYQNAPDQVLEYIETCGDLCKDIAVSNE